MQEKYTESPEMTTWVDIEQSKLNVQFTLLDVEKENITLMVDENGCYLSAPSGDLEYIATLSFLRPVKPSEAKATYEDGYLTVKLPFKETMDGYTKVPVE